MRTVRFRLQSVKRERGSTCFYSAKGKRPRTWQTIRYVKFYKLNTDTALMKTLSLISFLLSFSIYSFEVDKIDIENHPQPSFPSISLTIGDKTVAYYGMDSSQEGDLKFMKETAQLKGEVPLNGYIFAKEFVESFRLSNLASNKKDKSEFIKIFEEKDTGKLVDFILSVNEKKRSALSDEELKIASKIIKQKKSDESPEEIAIFSTGFIEIKSPKANNERYFIKVEDVNKKNMILNCCRISPAFLLWLMKETVRLCCRLVILSIHPIRMVTFYHSIYSRPVWSMVMNRPITV